MKTKMRTRIKRPKSGLNDLLRSACAQPGVRAIEQVYRQWESVDRHVRPYAEAMLERHVITASDTSLTTPW